LQGMRHGGNNRNAAGVALFGLAVLVIGYIGLFFGRWIKSAVSRQREYLADASAVQFTRSADGIGGALKKIGAIATGSRMVVSTEEVGHMLFAQGFSAQLFATHPPLLRRIQAVDPNFDPAEFKTIGQQLLEDRRARRFAQEQEAKPQQQAESKGAGGLPLNPDTLIEQIGQPDVTQLLLVAALLAELPEPLQRAAHADDWAVDVLLYLLLSSEADQRDEQLLLISKARGGDSEQQVRSLFDWHGKLAVRLRLPLMEQAFPNVRRQPQPELIKLMALVEQLIDVDGKVDVFEYVLARLLNREIEDALAPSTARTSGSARLGHHNEAWSSLLAVVAMHGQENDADAAVAAYAQAAKSLDPKHEPFTAAQLAAMMQAWPRRLDQAFAELKSLRLQDKQSLIEALLECIRYDGRIVTVEYELLRLVAGVLRVPLPVIA
ncbi:MAG: M48 family metalloprotease, partial [Pseudomonadota bacterium]